MCVVDSAVVWVCMPALQEFGSDTSQLAGRHSPDVSISQHLNALPRQHPLREALKVLDFIPLNHFCQVLAQRHGARRSIKSNFHELLIPFSTSK